MKSIKEGNLLRLIAIFLVAVTLVLTVGFASGGKDVQDGGQSGGTQNTEPPSEPTPTPPKIPDYLCYLTGLEITAELASSKRLCYVLNSLDTLYGISGARLVVELPCENGGSRTLAYIDEKVTDEPKIGSITKTRDYISNVASFFGGLIICSGNDDLVDYGSIDTSDSVIDLTGHVGYYYSENESKIYTNNSLIEALLLSRGISKESDESIAMPYIFNGYFSSPIKSADFARTVTVEYGENNITRFSYSGSGGYTVSKNGVNTVDPKTGSLLSYENVFVLFADTTTYEKIDGIEAVVDTATSGVGYYFTEGTKFNIRWYCDDAGGLVFLNDSGTRLTVNRGTSYISYAKSSLYGKIPIEV